MFPSTPTSHKRRIPFQPNPFGRSATGSPWEGELADVAGINDKPFRLILGALRQMRAGVKGTSIVLTGEPGSGKTHLLGRLRKRLHHEQEGKEATVYVYVRCDASAGTLWRHLRHALASDLLKGQSGSQLQDVFRSDPSRLDRVDHSGVRVVLECLRDGRHFHAASGWLRGEILGEADLAALGLAVEKEDEDSSRERDAKLAVNALLRFLAPTPVVLCFDQVEALETYKGDYAGYHVMGQMISVLSDGHEHLLLISCIVSAFEEIFDLLPNRADKERWLRHYDVLKPIDWDQAKELIKARLDLALPLKAARLTHPADPLWPIDEAALQPLFTVTGRCFPRMLIQACEQQFRELMGDDEPEPQKPLPEFLQEQFSSNLNEARKTVARQGVGITLSDCLPWLLQNSGFTPLGQDDARSRYANQGWRSKEGDTALVFCDGGGNRLTNQLRRVERNWNPQALKLAILRDVSTQPAKVGSGYLVSLKQKGAKEIHPLPEALAALHAIRSLVATARSGELSNGDEQVSEQAVTGWALANLPLQVEELRNGFTASKARGDDPDDAALPALSRLVNERKIIAADVAAAELKITPREVTECARRNPMRFGLLDGPPVVVFETSESPAR